MRIRKYLLIVAIMITVNVFGGDKTKIFSDTEYGYLYHYPSDWHANIYRSGVVLSQVQNRRRDSGLQVRIRSMPTKTEDFVRQYILSVKSGLGATLRDDQYGDNSGIDYVVLELSAIRGGVEYSLYHKLMFFPEHKKVLVLEAGWPVSRGHRLEPVVKKIMDSFWVFNAGKVANKR